MQIPFLSYETVGSRTEAFLSEYDPSFEVPIPIEDIVDVKMGIDIFPLPRLYKDFGISGFLSHDMTTIYVDEYQYDNYQEKYRFTLAHEIGHYVLHRDTYESVSFDGPDDYLRWILSFPRSVMTWFETHSDWFAEQVLVPTSPLIKICGEVVKQNENFFSESKIRLEDAWSYIANEVAPHFEVNPPVVEKRIRKARIPELIALSDTHTRG
jgi:hypothetical protein